jgi:hypothetical protein
MAAPCGFSIWTEKLYDGQTEKRPEYSGSSAEPEARKYCEANGKFQPGSEPAAEESHLKKLIRPM